MAQDALTLAQRLARPGGSVELHVTPKSSRNRIEAASFPDGSIGFRAWVTAAPARGKANKMVLGMLATRVQVPKSHLSIRPGPHLPPQADPRASPHFQLT